MVQQRDPEQLDGHAEATETATPHSESPDRIVDTITGVPPGARPVAFVDGFAPKTRKRYRVGNEIARGGLGRIHEAYDTELGRTVAIKELLRREPRAEARFVREATITARLEHPAIVPIHEAGRWPDGDPFYAMKLVDGRMLKDVVKETTTLEQRLALLPHVLAVAGAIAYAHAEGIIHRDLKPSNVLVGAYGETLVIDWGLAKDLTVDEDTEEPTSAASSSSAMVTVAGSVVGTPAYMAPEQARGDEVDERADVYAIGALLYYVLSGTPPFAGERHELVERVRTERPVPIEQRVPKIPDDLATLIGRAMAADPRDRYANAGELARDLRSYEEGRLVGAHDYSTWQLVRRWVARRRAAVAVAALMTAVLVAGAVVGVTRIAAERDRAEAQRKVAESERAEAEQLMDFMLVDLHERLDPIGKLDALGMVADRASEYWAQRPVDWSDMDNARRRAIAHANLGDVHQARGEYDAAMTEYETARDTCERLLELQPDDGPTQRVLGLAHAEIGALRDSRGDTDGAMDEFRRYAEIFQAQVDADPSNHRALREIHVAHNKIGHVLRNRGEYDAALAEHREALAISERLVAIDPSNDDWQYDVAASQTYIARVFREKGDAQAALDAYRRALPIYEKLVNGDPEDTHFLRNHAVGLDNIGDMLQSLGEAAPALEQYRAALAIRERLVQWEPGVALWQRDLAHSYDRIGYLARVRGDLDEALSAFQTSKEIRIQLQKIDPGSTESESVLAATINLLADVLQDRGDLVGALAEYEASMAIRRKLVEIDGANLEWVYDFALGHDMLGNVSRNRGEHDRAIAEYREALAIRQRLVDQSPDNARYQQKLALSHLHMGAQLETMKDPDAARSHLASAGAIYESFATEPNDLYNAACVFARAGNADKAFEMLDSAAARGFRQADWAAQDGDLLSLHGDPRWESTLDKMRD